MDRTHFWNLNWVLQRISAAGKILRSRTQGAKRSTQIRVITRTVGFFSVSAALGFLAWRTSIDTGLQLGRIEERPSLASWESVFKRAGLSHREDSFLEQKLWIDRFSKEQNDAYQVWVLNLPSPWVTLLFPRSGSEEQAIRLYSFVGAKKHALETSADNWTFLGSNGEGLRKLLNGEVIEKTLTLPRKGKVLKKAAPMNDLREIHY